MYIWHIGVGGVRKKFIGADQGLGELALSRDFFFSQPAGASTRQPTVATACSPEARAMMEKRETRQPYAIQKALEDQCAALVFKARGAAYGQLRAEHATSTTEAQHPATGLLSARCQTLYGIGNGTSF